MSGEQILILVLFTLLVGVISGFSGWMACWWWHRIGSLRDVIEELRDELTDHKVVSPLPTPSMSVPLAKPTRFEVNDDGSPKSLPSIAVLRP